VRCSNRARLARLSAGQASEDPAACVGRALGARSNLRQASIDEDVWLEDGCTVGGSASSSSSSMPPPRLVAPAEALASRNREHLRRHRDQKHELHEGDKAGKCDLTEATTASSHEECLSEISLESHLGVDHAAPVPTGACPTSRGASTDKVSPQNDPEPTDPLQQEVLILPLPEAPAGATMRQYMEEHCKGSPLSSPCVRSSPLPSPCPRPSPGEESALGEEFINFETALKMLKEYRQTQAKHLERIQSLTRERNALFQDRNYLEEELSRSQSLIAEKDETIEKLLSGGGHCHTL